MLWHFFTQHQNPDKVLLLDILLNVLTLSSGHAGVLCSGLSCVCSCLDFSCLALFHSCMPGRSFLVACAWFACSFGVSVPVFVSHRCFCVLSMCLTISHSVSFDSDLLKESWRFNLGFDRNSITPSLQSGNGRATYVWLSVNCGAIPSLRHVCVL